MAKVKISFPVALFAVSFVMCLLIAFLFMDRGENDFHESTSLRGLGAEAYNSKPAVTASLSHESLDAPTTAPVVAPESTARRFTSLPATPVTALPDSRNSSSGGEADADPASRNDSLAPAPQQTGVAVAAASPVPDSDAVGKAMTIFESRTGTPSQPADLPVAGPESHSSSPAPPAPQSPSPPSNLVGNPSLASPVASAAPVLQAPIDALGAHLVAPVTPDTPKEVGKGMVIARDGINGQQPPAQLQPQTQGFQQSSAPPIAVPEGVHVPTSGQTPSVLRRMRNVPTNLIQTPYPNLIQGNPEPAPGGLADAAKLPTDSGDTPVEVSTFQGPKGRQMKQAGLTQPPMGTPVSAMSGNPTIPTPIAPQAPAPPALPAGSNIAAGNLASSSPPKPSGGVVTNAGAEPSPTPNFANGLPGPAGVKAGGKWNLPAAPTLPPKVISKDAGKKTDALPPPSDLPDSAIVKSPDTIPSEAEPAKPAAKSQLAAAIPTSLPPVPSTKDSPPDETAKSLAPDGESKLSAKLRDQPGNEISKRLSNFDAQQVASVGNKVLLGRDALRRADAIAAMRGAKPNEDDRRILARTLAEEWAEVTAIAGEASRQGLTVSDEEVRAYIEKQKQRTGRDLEGALAKAGFGNDEIMAQMHDPALCEKMIDTAYAKQFDEKKLKALYDANPEYFKPPRRIHVMEIFRTRPSDANEAQKVVKEMQILQGKAAKGDFAEIASQSSEGPTKSKGGDLGWLDDKSIITPETGEALARLTPGQVSGVIESADGYRILKLAEIKEPGPGFEAARDRVVKGARDYLRLGAYETARMHTTVKIGPRVLTSEMAGKMGAMGSRTMGSGSMSKPVEPLDNAAVSGAPISPGQFGGLASGDFGKPISGDVQRPIITPKAR